jgi:hypothetical protein
MITEVTMHYPGDPEVGSAGGATGGGEALPK